MKSLELSIIIVSYNTCQLLHRCLTTLFTSLGKAAPRYEVIVVDNASTDASSQMVRKNFPQVRLIQNNTNTGFGAANNQGAKAACGKTLLFLNSDIEVINSAIRKLYTFYKFKPDAIVGGKLFNPDKTPQSSCGPKYSLLNIFLALFLKGDHLHLTRYSPETIKRVDWVMGACLIISKSFFERLGGFDEGIFMYMEEIDLQKRAQEAGGQIYFYPEAHFIHVGHASSGSRASPIQNVFRGLLYYYNKHYGYAQNLILRVLLVFKAISAILLFTLLGKKADRDIYIGALKSVT